MVTKIHVDCPLCGADDPSQISLNDGYPICRCSRCSMVYVNPQPAQDSIMLSYDRPDILDTGPKAAWTGQSPAGRERLWASRLASVEKVIPTGRLLDVGCGMGDFLRVALASGWNAAGTEVSKDVAQRVRGDLGCTVYTYRQELAQIGLEGGTFDVITAWHVIEHLPRPVCELREMARLLRPNGLLVVEVPNVDFYAMPSYLEPLHVQLHLQHFSARTLQLALESAGLQVLLVEAADPRGLLAENPLVRLWSILRLKALGLLSRKANIWRSEALRAYAVKSTY